ncbi:MAG: proline racemase family protein [Anaerolineae bacterium]
MRTRLDRIQSPEFVEDLLARFPHSWLTLDSHTVGEPTRLVLNFPPVPGQTINDKRLYIMREMDYVRLLLTQEPRGHRDMIAAILTEPVTKGASFGLIYMDARRYPYLCGHGTIGAVTALVETGLIQAHQPEATITVDTPAGPMEVTAQIKGHKVASVTIQAVPCFAYLLNQTLDVPGIGRIKVDISYAGGFFVMVSKEQVGLELKPENVEQLAPMGMAIIEEANQQLIVQHPVLKHVTTVDVAEFYDPIGHAQRRGLNMVVYGECHVDRSPCGTGTCAKMALLYRRGELGIGETFINAGVLGTTFEGKLLAETRVGDIPAVIPQIKGSAYLTGLHRFFVDPSDPFPTGFLL